MVGQRHTDTSFGHGRTGPDFQAVQDTMACLACAKGVVIITTVCGKQVHLSQKCTSNVRDYLMRAI